MVERSFELDGCVVTHAAADAAPDVDNRDLARWCRLMGILISSGVPTSRALELVFVSTPNSLLQRITHEMWTEHRDGETLALIANKYEFLGASFASMIDVGEETEQLGTVLCQLADRYDSLLSDRGMSVYLWNEPICWLLKLMSLHCDVKLPCLRTLRICICECPYPRLKITLGYVCDEIESGATLSEAFVAFLKKTVR